MYATDPGLPYLRHQGVTSELRRDDSLQPDQYVKTSTNIPSNKAHFHPQSLNRSISTPAHNGIYPPRRRARRCIRYHTHLPVRIRKRPHHEPFLPPHPRTFEMGPRFPILLHPDCRERSIRRPSHESRRGKFWVSISHSLLPASAIHRYAYWTYE